MATNFSNSVRCTVATDAAMQAFATFIDFTMTNGGWVVTADTGQTLPSAMVHPTVANQKVGYRIYRMNDVLQTTAPVFVRIDYGTGGNVGAPQIAITIGTGSNGSGTITGQMIANQKVGTWIFGPTNGVNCYGAAQNNYVTIGMWSNPAGTDNLLLCFGIERSKDLVGSDGTDVLFVFGTSDNTTTTLAYSNYLVRGLSLGAQPLTEGGLNYVMSGKNPSDTFAPGDVGVGAIFTFKGNSQQPGTCFLVTNTNDVSAEGSIDVVIYAIRRTYQQLVAPLTKAKANTPPSTSNAFTDTNSRILMRYE